MFRHPAWAVGSYRSVPPVVKNIGIKSTGDFHQRDVSPCSCVTTQKYNRTTTSSVAAPTATTTYFLLLFELDDVVRSEKTLDS